jgi:hypothetical protein
METPRLLNTVRLPARIDSQQAGEILGMSQVEISILVSAGLLKPIGITNANYLNVAARARSEFKSAK